MFFQVIPPVSSTQTERSRQIILDLSFPLDFQSISKSYFLHLKIYMFLFSTFLTSIANTCVQKLHLQPGCLHRLDCSPASYCPLWFCLCIAVILKINQILVLTETLLRYTEGWNPYLYQVSQVHTCLVSDNLSDFIISCCSSPLLLCSWGALQSSCTRCIRQIPIF